MYLLHIALVVISTLIGAELVSAVKFKDCGSVDGKIKSVDITNCQAWPCPLKRGTNVGITVSFKSGVDSKKSTAVVHGIIGGVPLPFPIPKADGCKSGISCPITKGSSYEYKNNIAISKNYPKVSVIVKWELKDDASKDLFCFEVSAEITD